jgi:Putative beta barrel porin-7 (BBP7)
LRLEDEVQSGEQFQVAPGVHGFGGSNVTLQDEFRTVNDFYGGQVGAEAGVQFGPLMIDFRCKIALGQMQQVADVNGATDLLNPGRVDDLLSWGPICPAQQHRPPSARRACLHPRVGLNVGVQLTRHLKLFVGYSFLWISTVARAGEEIDPVINVSQFPIRSGDGPLVGRARPAPRFHGTDFWAQGLNFGLELRY